MIGFNAAFRDIATVSMTHCTLLLKPFSGAAFSRHHSLFTPWGNYLDATRRNYIEKLHDFTIWRFASSGQSFEPASFGLYN